MKTYQVFYLNSDGGPATEIVRAVSMPHAAWLVAKKTDATADYSTTVLVREKEQAENG